ncbi:4'-phosphopantetheinyl transferase [Jannaschia pagri]|uniref:4'-phosphopantetheinyl transferase n=1 Tax=Jannaschia pagri TaxID=2829797 RepID=A0ABQ4NN58_9RHOB|nr:MULTISPECIES: 4'-phosphopantetheinyl transferase superfamily protein [unclassified Jannaschia]GIT92008.1 4'-phosphopantetheinyl transferase [Jannaschia sp. AI_61]GIT95842.1 4'-phosphopantetheinyl transferase [Jannaschia sp. AI_62]
MPDAPVRLYVWHLTSPDEATALSAHLSDAELAQARRFVKPADGVAYRLGRGRMREILGAWVGTDPAALSFVVGPSGKPCLCPGPHFNLSHSGGLACLAVHPNMPLGVDIEAPRPVEPSVARRFFSAAEQKDLSALPQTEWREGFFRCWTRKEAVVKALGLGLGADLAAFDVTLAPGHPAAVTRCDLESAQDWSLTHFELTPGWIGALAMPGRKERPRIEVALCPPDVDIHCGA